MNIFDIIDQVYEAYPLGSFHDEEQKKLSGNIFLTNNEMSYEDWVNDGSVSFECGPEHSDLGYCTDYHSCYDWLSKTLKEFSDNFKLEVEIGAAENYHMSTKHNMTQSDAEVIWLELIHTLSKALEGTDCKLIVEQS